MLEDCDAFHMCKAVMAMDQFLVAGFLYYLTLVQK
jgi:hypothetical protein